MADTAIKTEEEKKEFFDEPEILDLKVQQLAEWVREAQNLCCFTGAGISTSAGIPDYRSGYGTVLETGPGCWEKAAFKNKYKEDLKKAGAPLPNAYRVPFNTTIQQARPTRTHMAMVELANRGILKGVVSQNIDGLHRKSGIDPDILADLHGNTNLELCMKCGREHMRDFRVRTAQKAKEHRTGRICDTPGCKGELKDTIINFGEGLVPEILRKGFALHAMSDLSIAMGSSMRVSPACEMPLGTKLTGGKFVMINLQKTQMDAAADLVIHERVDRVIELLMEKLEIPIPDFRRSYRLKVSLSQDKRQVLFTGVDSNGACYTLFKSLRVTGLTPAAASFPARGQAVQPFTQAISNQRVTEISAQCTFQGHYNEPVLTLKVPMDVLRSEGALEFDMVYHVASGRFERVAMLNSATRADLGAAQFATVAAAQPQAQRGGSPAARPTPASRAPAPTKSAANRGKSTNVTAVRKARPAFGAAFGGARPQAAQQQMQAAAAQIAALADDYEGAAAAAVIGQ